MINYNETGFSIYQYAYTNEWGSAWPQRTLTPHSVSECASCGSLVINENQHSLWHGTLDIPVPEAQNTVMKRIIRTSEEQDAYTVWRKLYCYTQRAGVIKAIKKRTHKRERRDSKRWIEEQLND